MFYRYEHGEYGTKAWFDKCILIQYPWPARNLHIFLKEHRCDILCWKLPVSVPRLNTSWTWTDKPVKYWNIPPVYIRKSIRLHEEVYGNCNSCEWWLYKTLICPSRWQSLESASTLIILIMCSQVIYMRNHKCFWQHFISFFLVWSILSLFLIPVEYFAYFTFNFCENLHLHFGS